ncbi:MAG: hypothetical protein AAF657_12920 [Acidobacteriota bacterium]
MSRRIIGNLDCESDFARTSGNPRGPLPRRVLATLASSATLLRALAQEGDRLWLPAELPAEAMLEVPGLPRPTLEQGPLRQLSKVDSVLAWGETTEVAAIRRPAEGIRSQTSTPVDRLWRLPTSRPEAAARVNHRGFCNALAEAIGCRLPGATLLDSPNALKDYLTTRPTPRWILKAPYSAAGRWRYIDRGGSWAEHQQRIDRLFANHGPLLFEPWMERTADFGISAAITPEGWWSQGLHRLQVDSDGRFTGLELRVGDEAGAPGPWLDEGERATLRTVLGQVAEALARVGYWGPFGIDCWRYRQLGGGEVFHPLGEINARLTFGWVGQVLVERLRAPLGLEPGDHVRLLFSKALPDETPARIVPLFAAQHPTARAIWLEIQPSHP